MPSFTTHRDLLCVHRTVSAGWTRPCRRGLHVVKCNLAVGKAVDVARADATAEHAVSPTFLPRNLLGSRMADARQVGDAAQNDRHISPFLPRHQKRSPGRPFGDFEAVTPPPLPRMPIQTAGSSMITRTSWAHRQAAANFTAHSTASSRELTSTIAKPPSTALVSGNGPSAIVPSGATTLDRCDSNPPPNTHA